MIIDERFLEWYKTVDDDMRGSTINFVLYVCAGLNFIDRIKIAIEIILGRKYFLWVSRNQRSLEGRRQ
jgi:hypothetical protein